MEKKLLKIFEEKLKKERQRIEKELEKFAKKANGSWEVIFPKFNGGETGGGILEKGADEVEEYTLLLALKPNLEKKLKDIDLALEKIKKGNFGICEKCKGEIEKEKLEISPETKFCLKCKKS